ncbi:MAG: YtxH domain-containing protein [Geobacter sp.]|jgi:gas vesicle protein|nr:YtxH domain-containing protein [Geobacter sp.]
MSRSNDHAITTTLLALASGALLGAAAALLLAPAPGKETRRKLVDLTDDAGKRIKNYSKETRHKMGGWCKGKGEDLQYDGGDAWI